jgi:hypothetical protein
MRLTSSRLVSISLLLALSFGSLTQTACPGDGGNHAPPTKEEILRYAREGVGALNDILPILRANSIGTAKIEKGIQVGNKVLAAFENNQSSDALLLTAELLDVFDQSVAEFELLKDGSAKTAILVGCAIAQVALRHFASLVESSVTAVEGYRSSVPGVTSFQDSSAKTKAEEAKAKIKAFKKQKQFRCKNAVTGKFAEMAYCKANPETSYVVTFSKR